MTIHNPTMVYDFARFSATTPTTPFPGDRVQAQFQNHADVLNEIVAQLLTLGSRLVTAGDLDPGVFSQLQADLAAVLTPVRDQTLAAAGDAETAKSIAIAAAASASAQSSEAIIAAGVVEAAADGTIGSLNSIKAEADAKYPVVLAKAEDADNAANDAEGFAELAGLYAEACSAWAEYMPGTIPPNILAVMGITGDHWSSRWWANKASQDVSSVQDALSQCLAAAISANNSAEDAQDSEDAAEAAATQSVNAATAFSKQYLGNKSSDPIKDNQGGTLIPGALYFNTTSNQMRNWNGTVWQNLAGGAGITDAPADGNAYNRRNNAWIVATGGGGGVPEAPNDGTLYARSDLAWTQFTVPTSFDYTTQITGKPATFPPAPHSHPQSDITGLTAALALLAPKADPVFTGTANFNQIVTTSSATFASMACTGAAAFTGAVNMGGASAVLVPTLDPSDHSSSAASTNYVWTAIGSVVGSFVTGPNLATDNGVALWDGTTGKLLKNSGALAAIARSGTWADLGGIPALVSALAAMTGAAANVVGYYTSATAMAVTALTAFGRSLIGAANAAAARATLVAEQLGVLAGVNTQTASYTLVAADVGKVIELNLAGANNFTIDTDANQPGIPVGSRIDVVQYGAGQTTLVAASGVTLRNKYGAKFSGQYAAASFYKRGTNEWLVFGDLTT